MAPELHRSGQHRRAPVRPAMYRWGSLIEALSAAPASYRWKRKRRCAEVLPCRWSESPLRQPPDADPAQRPTALAVAEALRHHRKAGQRRLAGPGLAGNMHTVASPSPVAMH